VFFAGTIKARNVMPHVNQLVTREVIKPVNSHYSEVIKPVNSHYSEVIKPVNSHYSEVIKPVNSHYSEVIKPENSHYSEHLNIRLSVSSKINDTIVKNTTRKIRDIVNKKEFGAVELVIIW
jgi:hypothetical protein